jgi:hypothetical protein
MEQHASLGLEPLPLDLKYIATGSASPRSRPEAILLPIAVWNLAANTFTKLPPGMCVPRLLRFSHC